MFRIFISYNNENREIVKTLADDIATLGHQVWLTASSPAAAVGPDTCEIRQCHVFVFALSPEALDRIHASWNTSVRLNKSIFNLASGGVSRSAASGLSKLQHVDYRRQDRQAALAIARAFSSLTPSPPLPSILPDPPDVPISYMGELKDHIDGVAPLGFDAQTALVLKLKERLRQKTDAKDGRKLLERLRKRPDLFALVAAEIDEALAGHAESSIKPRSPARVPRKEPAVPALVPQAQTTSDAQPRTDASARDITVDTGSDEVAGVLRRLLKKRERWAFVALPLRYVSVVSDGKTITAEAVFSDVADVLGGAGNKLKESGWQKSPARTTVQLLTSIAAGLSIGTLLLKPEGQGVLRDERHEPVVADVESRERSARSHREGNPGCRESHRAEAQGRHSPTRGGMTVLLNVTWFGWRQLSQGVPCVFQKLHLRQIDAQRLGCGSD